MKSIAVLVACVVVSCSTLASARSVAGLASQSVQSMKGRHLLAHIEMEELRHISRGLRQDDGGFTYGELDGYKNWGGICQQADEIAESPIDIPQENVREAYASPSGAMSFDYSNLEGATVTNTGHGPQVNVAEGNIMSIGNERWQLLQYHFHTPSEHALRGRLASMEIHFVHSNVDTGDLAVIGILMNAANRRTRESYSTALAQALSRVPDDIKGESDPFTLSVDTFTALLVPTGALPAGRSTGSGEVPVVTYSGSLTTPPCTAGVTWFVIMKSTPVGANQVLSFQRFLGNGTTISLNSRPLVPSLDRDISTDIAALGSGASDADSPDAAEAPAAGSTEADSPDVDAEVVAEVPVVVDVPVVAVDESND